MGKEVSRILREALRLPENERAGLAADLLSSLPAGPAQRSDQDWIVEVERRAKAALSGEPGFSWEEAQARIRERLNRS